MKQYFLQIKKALSNKNRGASLTGYGLMVGLIAVVAIVAIGNIGSNVSLLFSRTSNVLEAASSGTNFAASTPTAASLSIAVTTGDKDNMDITGPTNPAFGTMVSFTIQNIGETTTGVLSGGTLSTDTSSTGDTDNFEFDTSGGVGNSCAGITLAPNASCNLDIRPFASNSGSYTGTLSISDINLNENISLSGTASGPAILKVIFLSNLRINYLHFSSIL